MVRTSRPPALNLRKYLMKVRIIDNIYRIHFSEHSQPSALIKWCYALVIMTIAATQAVLASALGAVESLINDHQ
jgi:hypothetical protein